MLLSGFVIYYSRDSEVWVLQVIRDALWLVEVHCGHLTSIQGGIYSPPDANSASKWNLCDLLCWYTWGRHQQAFRAQLIFVALVVSLVFAQKPNSLSVFFRGFNFPHGKPLDFWSVLGMCIHLCEKSLFSCYIWCK